MPTFVIYRSFDGGKSASEYLMEDGREWSESPAVAKWFHTEVEAEKHNDEGYFRHPVYIKEYDPTDTLLNPTETDRGAMVRQQLQSLLRRRA